MVIVAFVFLVITVVCFYYAFRSSKQSKRVEEIIKSVPGKEHAVYIQKREARIRDYIRVKKYVTLDYSYRPPSATYSSATVGGVTTGGWDVKEERYSETVKQTDKYELSFCGHQITEVWLPFEDENAARTDNRVCQFVDTAVGNKLLLKHRGVKKQSVFVKDALQAGNIAVAASIAADDLVSEQLSKKEANDVLDFLCGKANLPTESKSSQAQSDNEKPEICVHLYKKTGICGSAWSNCNGKPCQGSENCTLFRAESKK